MKHNLHRLDAVPDEFFERLLSAGRNAFPANAQPTDCVQSTIAACVAVYGALQSLAILPIHPPENPEVVDTGNIGDFVNDEHILFAALLATEAIKTLPNQQQIQISFGPPTFKAAIQKYTKLTGKDPDFLCDSFREAANSTQHLN